MMKRVVYNGGTESWGKYFDDPRCLIKGQVYEVEREVEEAWNTTYFLKGIKGEYNSCWFNEVNPLCIEKKVYLATTRTAPVVGTGMTCERIYNHNGVSSFQKVKTSTVEFVDFIGSNTYKVETGNSRYFVQVI